MTPERNALSWVRRTLSAKSRPVSNLIGKQVIPALESWLSA